MVEFVHLHNHSDFSLLDGAASIPKLIAKAKTLGMKHLALTDHGNLFGALKFYKECRKAGLNPLVGSEFYVAPGSRLVKSGSESGNRYYHLVLIARNAEGYKNLRELSSLSYTEGFYYKPRIDDELLARFSGGLLGLSACLAGEIPTLINADRMKDARAKAALYRDMLGPGNFYLELQDHGLEEQKTANRGILELARSLELPVIASNDAHYIDRDDAVAQDILICVGTGKKRSESARLKFEGDQFYFKTPQEMEALFGSVPEVLRNTLEVGERCELTIPLPGPLLPDFEIPAGFAGPEEYLRHLARTGLAERFPSPGDALHERLEYELEVITKTNFTGYFLIVWDFIHYAKQHGIPVGPGRGSGAGSLAAYSLQITDIDPIKYGLLFERFLNPERKSMPDFDIDFCFERRQEVIDYVTRRYGADKVGQIITFGTLKPKAVLKDVARVMEIPFEESNRITDLIADGPKVTLEKAFDTEPALKELEGKSPLYQELFSTGRKLEGLSRHASTHAAGIVIGKTRLTDYVPLYRDPKTGAITTQFTMEQLEECGLVKMDFLGLKTLTLIKNTEALIRQHDRAFDIRKIPEDDKKTFDLLGEGRSACIFQFESSGMQGVLKQAKPNSISELTALNALYRPGPMEEIPQFIDAKWGRKPISYPLPALEPILKETYGVIVYQEQVMEIARVVAGYSLGQADLLRRAMGKKKAEEMAKEKLPFIKGAAERGYTEKQAAELFELLARFADYGFNKSHAAAYSVLAYQTAYLKANHPAEFMAANLTNEIGNPDTLAEYIAEARMMGLELLAPDINKSDKHFSVVDGKILYGLLGIKNVGEAAVEQILAARAAGPFTSIFDFLDRVDLKTVNRKVVETAVQCGLFDAFGATRATLMQNLDMVIAYADRRRESRLYGQSSLFEASGEDEYRDPALAPLPEFPEAELLKMEKSILGFYISGHPLDPYRELWKKAVNLDLAHPERSSPEASYQLLGLLREVKTIITKKGSKMAFATLSDFAGSIELVIFSDLFEAHQAGLHEEAVLAVTGKVDTTRGSPKFVVKEIKDPRGLAASAGGELHIRFSRGVEEEQELLELREFLFDNKGEFRVFLHFPSSNGRPERIIKVSGQISVSAGPDLLEKISAYPHVLEAWKQ